MRKTVLAVFMLLVANFASAQVLINPGGGGSGTTTLISGTTTCTGSSANSVLFMDTTTVNCADTGLIYAKATQILTMLGGATIGSTTTAATATSSFLGTITTGQSFLNITGTFPAVRTNETSGALIAITSGDSDDFQENGLKVTLTNGSGSLSTANSAGILVTNAIVQGAGGIGFGVDATGYNSGLIGRGGASNFTAGVIGTASNAGTSAVGGAFGGGTGATNRVGVYATLGAATLPNITGTYAALFDNLAVAAPIMCGRDNGTDVTCIPDGGGLNTTQAIGLGSVTAPDAGLRRIAAGVIEPTLGGANDGWIQTAGEVALNADYTNATASFTSTALSVTVISGRTYNFSMNLMFDDSTAADGAQFDFNGGSAAATNFRVHCISVNAAGAILAQSNAASTALATANAVTLALTTQANLTCNGTFVPSGNGTFIVRGAQSAHTAGTLSIRRGSWLSVRDSRPL